MKSDSVTAQKLWSGPISRQQLSTELVAILQKDNNSALAASTYPNKGVTYE